MGLFNEIKCVHCGKKTGLMTRTKLDDGQYICSKCSTGVPISVLSKLNECDYAGFIRVKEYVEYSDNELSKVFKKTHSFHGIHIDTEHKLFYLDRDHPRIYYKFEEIEDFGMTFSADEVKDGFLSTKVNGNIYYELKLGFPGAYVEEALVKNVKANAKVKKGLVKSTVVYDNPKGMDEFLVYFNNAWKSAIDEKIDRVFREEREEAREQARREVYGEANLFSEVQAAITLFMFDSLDDLTLEKLDKQRKRLLKTFHPDEGLGDDTGFAQKINAAYDVLKIYAK